MCERFCRLMMGSFINLSSYLDKHTTRDIDQHLLNSIDLTTSPSMHATTSCVNKSLSSDSCLMGLLALSVPIYANYCVSWLITQLNTVNSTAYHSDNLCIDMLKRGMSCQWLRYRQRSGEKGQLWRGCIITYWLVKC